MKRKIAVRGKCCQQFCLKFELVCNVSGCARYVINVPISRDFMSLFPTGDTLRYIICLFIPIRKNISSRAAAESTSQNRTLSVTLKHHGTCVRVSSSCLSSHGNAQHLPDTSTVLL